MSALTSNAMRDKASQNAAIASSLRDSTDPVDQANAEARFIACRFWQYIAVGGSGEPDPDEEPTTPQSRFDDAIVEWSEYVVAHIDDRVPPIPAAIEPCVDEIRESVHVDTDLYQVFKDSFNDPLSPGGGGRVEIIENPDLSGTVNPENVTKMDTGLMESDPADDSSVKPQSELVAAETVQPDPPKNPKRK